LYEPCNLAAPPKTTTKLETIPISPPPLPHSEIQKNHLPPRKVLVAAYFQAKHLKNGHRKRVSRRCEWTFKEGTFEFCLQLKDSSRSTDT
jgi:hypothetical protein